ncbi:MAG TPA: tRNA (N(6)-L-threonylcarbamoyladenosine(37)-C(2))-methylthiotransferase MtaB [Candidatus Limnocylindrales bacterium]|nr:tRNA (N(6)-L-threonylcarbamoyladenosine(37)-C(2))-methylthiotransferase MtaB [Candidatus Limnocylindrales bacterium]
MIAAPVRRTPRTLRTAAITNLGCKVNQAEMEAAARLLRERGVTLVDDRSPADLHLINTCTVTSVADQKSRQAVRRARRVSPDAELVVTGCSVQVDRSAFAAAVPGARLVDNRAKDALLAELAHLAEADGGGSTQPGGRPIRAALPTLSGVELDGAADDRAATDRTRAFVKVQDGCSFFCTYCIIPAARGPERSLAPDVVLADVRRALAAGRREIVLTGINIGTYDGGWSERGPRGSHRRSALTLAGLVRRILAETDVERIRLSSIEPQHVDDDLLAAWTVDGAGRCLPHVHLPLQSGDDGVLRRMGRRYDSAFYADLVARLRSAIPGLAVHGDVIVGFPTEDDAAWERSLAFIRAIGFAGLHVFRYSERPGTPAARMAGQVPEAARRARSAALLEHAAERRAAFAAEHVGATASVLFETALPDGRWIGHAEDHVVVSAATPVGRSSLEHVIASVVIESVDMDVPDRLVGRVVASPGGPNGQ